MTFKFFPYFPNLKLLTQTLALNCSENTQRENTLLLAFLIVEFHFKWQLKTDLPVSK